MGRRVGLTTLQYYWGNGKTVFKGRRLPADKPFLRAAREVLMSHGASQQDLLNIFGPFDGPDDLATHQEMADIRTALSELHSEMHDIKTLLLRLSERVTPD